VDDVVDVPRGWNLDLRDWRRRLVMSFHAPGFDRAYTIDIITFSIGGFDHHPGGQSKGVIDAAILREWAAP
jgi:hypothetical protein